MAFTDQPRVKNSEQADDVGGADMITRSRIQEGNARKTGAM
jgi:hypothetical protein